MRAETMSGPKDGGIETLRGLAILLMVSGHVIGADSSTGLTVGDDSPFRYFYYSTQFIRMPLFTVISGYVYSLRPVYGSVYGRFVWGKSRRILVPFVTVSTLQYVARALTVDVNRPLELSNVWQVYAYPFDHFWFLQSIFLVFLTVGAWDRWGWMSDQRRWCACFLLSIAATSVVPRFTSVFGFNGYLYLLPYFVLGCGLCRFPDSFQRPLILSTIVATFSAAVGMQQLAWFCDWSIDLDRVGPLAMAVGIPTAILLITRRFDRHWLSWVGHYSFGIYLFHVFGTAGCRVALTRAGLESDIALFGASLVAGVTLPIILERFILPRVPLLEFCLLGHSPKASSRKRRPTPRVSTAGSSLEVTRT
jgi:peptidoglycan/LPS O-acetylase OafA/YrhL